MKKKSYIKVENEKDFWRIIEYLGDSVIISKGTLKELFDDGYRYIVKNEYGCVEVHGSLDSFEEEENKYEAIDPKIIIGDGSPIYLIKAFKYYHNGTIEKYLLVSKSKKEEYTHKDILEYVVEEWCKKDLRGHNYGWNSDFEWVSDKAKLKEVLAENVDSLNRKVKYLNSEIEDLGKIISSI